MGDVASALSIAKDITLTIAGATGTWVAAKGLSTWRRQLRGQTHFEAARKLLRSTYRHRDALQQVRNPIMWGSETAPFPGEEDPPPDLRHAVEQQRGYRRRLQAVSEIARDFAADMLEAEVLWGGNVSELGRPLINATIDLDVAISMYVQRLREGPNQTPRTEAQIREEHRVLFPAGRDPDDPLRKQVDGAVQGIEGLVRKHLGA